MIVQGRTCTSRGPFQIGRLSRAPSDYLTPHQHCRPDHGQPWPRERRRKSAQARSKIAAVMNEVSAAVRRLAKPMLSADDLAEILARLARDRCLNFCGLVE